MNNNEMTELEIAQYEMFRKMMGQQPPPSHLEGSIFDDSDFSHVDSMFAKQKGLKLMA